MRKHTYKPLTLHLPSVKAPNKHPNEDFVLVKDGIFGIFDGVTLAHQDPYPDPSPAAEAAKIGAKAVVGNIEQNRGGTEGLRLIRESFTLANKQIRELNNRLGVTPETIDYLNKQYAAAVGCFGFVKDAIFYFGQLNDCGVAVFDQQGNQELDFVENQQPLIKYLQEARKRGLFEPGSKEEHIHVRSQIVNNKEIAFAGEYINFGVMTGEENAGQFLRIGAFNLHQNQIAVFYSDGFSPFIYDSRFVNLLLQAPRKNVLRKFIEEREKENDKYRKEKSLILIRRN